MAGVLIDIGHPAHAHVFRHVVRNLSDRGVPVHVTARRKDLSLRLLDAFGIPYEEIGGHRAGLAAKAAHAATRICLIARAMRRGHVRVAMGVHNPYVAVAARCVGVHTAILVDSEPVRYDRILTYPFADYLLTPRGFANDLGRKQVRFDGYKELAYLHPNQFRPDPAIYRELGMDPQERFFLVRFVAWAAEHDVRQRGLSPSQKRRLMAMLENHGRVFLSSEAAVPHDLQKYTVRLAPERIHHALAFASLLVSESQTMTTEAAVLGTPVVQTNTLVGTMSNFRELQDRYGLITADRNAERALSLAEFLASNPDAKRETMVRRARLLTEKIDVAEYLTEVAERLLAGKRPAEGRVGA